MEGFKKGRPDMRHLLPFPRRPNGERGFPKIGGTRGDAHPDEKAVKALRRGTKEESASPKRQAAVCRKVMRGEVSKGVNKGEDRILWTEKARKRKAIRIHLFLFFSLLLLLFIGGSLFYVWSRIQVIHLGYEISVALKEGKALTEANKRMRLEAATLKSNARIEKIAVEELKMVKPKPDQVIVIR
jgi:cell division protein FtsL